MAGPPNNIPLRAKGYLESGIGLINTLTLTRTLTLTPILTITRTTVIKLPKIRRKMISDRNLGIYKGILFGGPAMENSLDTRRR